MITVDSFAGRRVAVLGLARSGRATAHALAAGGATVLAWDDNPAVRDAALARSWAGLEAFTPDEIPLIGPVPGIEGLLVAAGFCGHGFALSPAVGDILARLALGRDAREHLWRGLRVDRSAVVSELTRAR